MDKKYLADVAQYNAVRWWTRIGKAYPSIGLIPAIKLNGRMWARFAYASMYLPEDRHEEYISLSTENFWYNTDKFASLVIPHELMHIAAWRVYEDKGHGYNWKKMMREFGLPDTSTLEGFDLTALNKHRANRA